MFNWKNEVTLEGNLTKEPEFSYTPKGTPLCKFDIAVNSKSKKGETEYNEVLYISVTTWNNIAEACAKFLKKGSPIRVKGSLKMESWTGKDGVKRQKHSIVAERVLFIRRNMKKTA